MFRLFLRKRVLAGDSRTAKSESASSLANAGKRNRRVFPRHAVDHKHLTLMNEQDILLVREISAKGFSTEVSPRGYERLVVGDVYDARARYLGEIYDLEAKVIWKNEGFVGFEIVKAGHEALTFIKRLLRPIEIASSLQPVEATFTSEASQGQGKSWFHGDDDSDLYVWHDPETNALTAWQLAVGSTYIEWNDARGMTTGSLTQSRDVLVGESLKSQAHRQDDAPDKSKTQFAVDVIMALPFPVRDEILETLSS